VRTALLAGCVVTAGLLLPACGESPTAVGDKGAQAKSATAAELTADAGQPRASKQLVDDLNQASGATITTTASDLRTQIKSGSPDAVKRFIETRPKTEDLKAAQQQLADALGKGGQAPSSLFKSALEAQLGDVLSAQAQLQLDAATDHLTKLSRQAADIESLARRVQTVGTLSGQATARSQAQPEHLSERLDEAQKTAESIQNRVAELEQKVSDLEAREKDLHTQATQIYSQAQAALNAADQATDLASIDAYKKAVAQRGKADALTAEAQTLHPELVAKAQDLALAKTQLQVARQSIDELDAMIKNAASRGKSDSEQAQKLSEQAQALIQNPEGGLKAQIAQFKNLAQDLHATAEAAQKAAESAQKNYSTAARELASYNASIHPEKYSPGNPLLTIINDRTGESLLKLMEANALYQAGQARLLAALGYELQTQADKSAAAAYEVAGLPSPAASANDAGATAKQEAQASFEAALKKLADAGKTAPRDTAGKWLVPALAAATNRNLYVLTGDDNYLKAAASSIEEAQAANKNLNLTALASGLGLSNNGAATESTSAPATQPSATTTQPAAQ
jgi:hypothetical protein